MPTKLADSSPSFDPIVLNHEHLIYEEQADTFAACGYIRTYVQAFVTDTQTDHAHIGKYKQSESDGMHLVWTSYVRTPITSYSYVRPYKPYHSHYFHMYRTTTPCNNKPSQTLFSRHDIKSFESHFPLHIRYYPAKIFFWFYSAITMH